MDLTKEERELLQARKLQEIKIIIREVQRRIVDRIRDAVNSPEPTQKYWNFQLANISKLYDVLNDKWSEWISPAMTSFYDIAYDLAEKIMRKARLEPVGTIPGASRIIDALINDTIKKMRVGSDASIGEINTLFREVQTSLLREDQINRAIAEGILESGTVNRVQSNLEKILYDRLVNKEQIVVAGSKHFTPEYYAELLARTRTRDAQSAASVQASLDYGVDLIQVSDHNTTTEICMKYEGQIFSISGKTPGYERLGEIAPFHPNCVSFDTEILTTENGWKLIKDVKIGEEVFTLNMETKLLEPSKVIKTFKSYSPTLVEFVTNDFHLAVTPNHRMVFENDHSRKNKLGIYKFIEAKDLIGKVSGRIPRSIKPVYSNINIKKVRLAQLVCFALADGYIDHKQKAVTIFQDPIKSPIGTQVLKNLLEECEINYTVSKSGRYYIKDLYEYLLDQKTSYHKFIPSWVKELPANAIDSVLYIFSITDGHIKKGRKFNGLQFADDTSYFTVSPKMASDLGEMILKVGRRPSYKIQKPSQKKSMIRGKEINSNYDLIIVRDCKNTFGTLQNFSIQEIPYNNYAYCVQVEKNNTIYVRSKWECTWTGNCLHTMLPLPVADAEDEAFLRAKADKIFQRNQQKIAQGKTK